MTRPLKKQYFLTASLAFFGMVERSTGGGGIMGLGGNFSPFIKTLFFVAVIVLQGEC